MGQSIVLIDASTDVLLDSEDAEDQHALSTTSVTESSDDSFVKHSKMWAMFAAGISAVALAIMVCTLAAATTTVDLRITTEYSISLKKSPQDHGGRLLLRNEIYGHCVSFHEGPAAAQEDSERNFTTWAMGVPAYDGTALVLTTGICDEDPWVVRFTPPDPESSHNYNIRSADNRCLVPLSPDQPGSHVTLAPCPVEPQPESTWEMVPMKGRNDTSKGMQVRNGLGLCLDLEHQQVYGYLIQWKCKSAKNYKSPNQLFKWVST